MTCLPATIFFAIAFVFSMLGMGGSQLYRPILSWSGMDFKTEAIPLGMLLNLVNSASAALTYGRKGIVAWLNIQLPVKPLPAFFSLLTAPAAVLMLSGWRPKRGAYAGPAEGEMSPQGRTILALTTGSGLGLVAGLIGRGWGSLIVPCSTSPGWRPGWPRPRQRPS